MFVAFDGGDLEHHGPVGQAPLLSQENPRESAPAQLMAQRKIKQLIAHARQRQLESSASAWLGSTVGFHRLQQIMLLQEFGQGILVPRKAFFIILERGIRLARTVNALGELLSSTI